MIVTRFQINRVVLLVVASNLLIALSSFARAGADIPNEPVQTDIDWAAFLGHCDLVWTQLPTRWQTAPIIGNGLLGAFVQQVGDTMSWNLGSTEVWDHRAALPGKQPDPAFDRCRLQIGSMQLHPVGHIVSTHLRLSLWDAELTGTITTSAGTITIRSYTHAVDPIIVTELDTTAGERNASWQWEPAISISQRANPIFHRKPPAGYTANPNPIIDHASDCQTCTQPMTAGGGYTTAWKDIATAPEHRRLLLSIGYCTQGDSDRKNAVAAVHAAEAILPDVLLQSHRAWWHNYYPQSFVSIPDARLEQFYWIQMYKLASATRAGRPVLDLYGPWTFPTAWPYICWDMNEPVQYSPAYTANRLALGENLCDALDNNTPNLIANVPPDFQHDSAGISVSSGIDLRSPMSSSLMLLGDLPWAMHNYWRQCRWAADDARLRDKLFPLLKRSMNLYLHYLKKGSDDKLHLPSTFSPEYGHAPDCNYDLSLIRWGMQTLENISDQFKLNDPDRAKWDDVLKHLVDYPQNADGLMIGAGVPLEHAHRHYSHLLMIFPLRILNAMDATNRDLIVRSLDHWMNVKGSGKLGFTYMAAASINAMLGQGDQALADLNTDLDKFIFANTMYAETCIETPLGMCESVHNMLMNSEPIGNGSAPGVIQIFPAVPTDWKSASFYHLRADGAFLVSANRTGGKTQWVTVLSLAGKPCVVQPNFDSPFSCSDGQTPEPISEGVYRLTLKAGESVVLSPKNSGTVKPMIRPVVAGSTNQHFYGLP